MKGLSWVNSDFVSLGHVSLPTVLQALHINLLQNISGYSLRKNLAQLSFFKNKKFAQGNKIMF